jgi:DUF4097 and DUF4098 domain-containing protein YvlB
MPWYGWLIIVVVVLAGLGLVRRRQRWTATFAGVRRVDVQTAAGRVEVIGEERRDVQAEVTVAGSLGRGPRHTEWVDGERLICRAGWWAPPFGFGWVDYRLRVPAGTAVTGSSGGGSALVDGVDGEVDVRSSAGTVTGRRLAGRVRLHSSAGTVVGSELSAPAAEADTSAGSVRLDFLTPPDRVEARSSAGSVDVMVPDEVYRVDATSSAGGVEISVRTDPGAGRRISARSSAGRVRVRRR